MDPKQYKDCLSYLYIEWDNEARWKEEFEKHETEARYPYADWYELRYACQGVSVETDLMTERPILPDEGVLDWFNEGYYEMEGD